MDERVKIAKYAYSTVMYYRELLKSEGIELSEFDFSRNWSKIPLAKKEDAILHTTRMISEGYLGQLAMGNLKRMHTSGSTGTCLDIYWSEFDYQKSLIPLWLNRWKYGKIRTRDKVCFFSTLFDEKKDFEYYKNSLIIAKTNLSYNKIITILQKIQEFEPKWILIQPSMALLLCEVIAKEKIVLPKSLQYMELTGEMLLPSWKTQIAKIFNCVVKCHYGTMEVSTIGYEENGMYRVLEESTYVEILDDDGCEQADGVEGNIYVTSLHNHVMPFVRYPTGDRGILYTVGNNKYIELCHARKNDRLTIEGKELPPDSLLYPVELLNLMYENVVYQLQIKQIDNNKLEVHVVLDEEFPKQEFIQFYLKHLQEYWSKEVVFEFIFENEIMIDEGTGKLRWFINQIKEE